MRTSKKNVLFVAIALCAAAVFGAGEPPQVSILPWTNSLDVVDYQDNPVSLDHAEIVHRYVDGVVPAHDSKYNSWRMEFMVRFDRPVKKNGVTFYGQIFSEGQDSVWNVIETYFTKEPTHKVWKPIEIPAMAAGQELMLVRTMLGSSFNVFYNKTSVLLNPPYGLSFLTWIQNFYCGIVFHSREYLGTTCTVDCVIIDPDNSNTMIVIDSFSYTYTDGKYGPDSPGRWFNARVGWYEEIPRDFQQCENCEVVDMDGESLSIKDFGKLEVDGDMEVTALTNRMSRRFAYKKVLTCKVEGGKSLVVRDIADAGKQMAAETNILEKTAACILYSEGGATNLLALAMQGNTNALVKLTFQGPIDWSGDVETVMTVSKYDGDSRVSYMVNGVYAAMPDGRTEFPVVVYGEEDRLRVSGSAVVTDAYGDLVRTPVGYQFLTSK